MTKKLLGLAAVALALAVAPARAQSLPHPNLGLTTQVNSTPLFVSGVFNPSFLPAAAANTLGGVELSTCAAHQFTIGVGAGSAGASTCAQPGFGDISGTAAPAQIPASQVLDTIGYAQGDLLYRDVGAQFAAGGWKALAPGSAGYVLATGGAGVNPSWFNLFGTPNTFTQPQMINNGSGSAAQLALSPNSYSSTPGVVNKVSYGFGSGIGVSAGQLDIVTPSGAAAFWNGATRTAWLDGSGNLVVAGSLKPTNALGVLYGGTGQTTAGLATLDAVAGASAPAGNNYVLTNGTGTPTWFNLFGGPNIWTGSQTVSGLFSANLNTQTVPAGSASVGSIALTWNFTNGGAEADLWNTFINPSSSFAFRQVTGSGLQTDLLDISLTGISTHVPLSLSAPLATGSGGTGNTNIYGTANTFTQPQTATSFIGTSNSGGTGSAFTAQSLAPAYSWKNTGGAGTDQNVWDLLVSGSTLLGRAISDNGAASSNWLEVDRSGYAISAVKMPTLTLNVTPLGTASGGTGCASASFVCLDNITGLSGASPTGILSRTGAGAYSLASLSAMLDSNFSSTQGSILYRGATGWTALAPGQNGYVLQSGGAGANPSWVPPSTSGATSVLLNTITISSGAASVSDTTSITSAYKFYDIYFVNIVPSANTSCILQFYQGGTLATSNYRNAGVGSSDYSGGSGASGSFGEQTGYMPCSSEGNDTILGYTQSSNSAGVSFVLHLFDPLQTVSGAVSQINNGFQQTYNGSATVYVDEFQLGNLLGGSTKGNVNGFVIKAASGNWQQGKIYVYGRN